MSEPMDHYARGHIEGQAAGRAAADAQIVALREALEAVHGRYHGQRGRWPDVDVARVLSDTAQAAAEAEARIRADAEKPWRKTVTDVVRLLDTYGGGPSGYDRLLRTARALLTPADEAASPVTAWREDATRPIALSLKERIEAIAKALYVAGVARSRDKDGLARDVAAGVYANLRQVQKIDLYGFKTLGDLDFDALFRAIDESRGAPAADEAVSRNPEDCSTCNGRGSFPSEDGRDPFAIHCLSCDGTGLVGQPDRAAPGGVEL